MRIPVVTRALFHRTAYVIAVLLCAVLVLELVIGCQTTERSAQTQKSVLNVGLIFGSGGLGDKSFNDSAYAGLLEAQKELDIRFDTINYSGTESDIDALRLMAKKNYDLIIGVAFENMKNIQTMAGEFPNIHFAAIDFELTADNVSSVVYREQEADFLMGVLAAMLTKTKKVGVIGGTDIPAIRRIMSGFQQGVAYQDSSVEVFSEFAGTFSDPQVGLTTALKMYDEGMDVIHNAASKTGLGIIQAAQQVDKLTTGTSGDQRSLAPGNMVGNRPKKVDTAVLLIIRELSRGKFQAGILSLGLKENGMSLGPFDSTLVTQKMLDRLDVLKQKIIDGEIVVKAE